MCNRFVLTRIILISGILLTPAHWLRGQEGPINTTERTATVAGRVLGSVPIQNRESLAVLLLPGWSDTLNAEIVAGRSPAVLLESGRINRIMTGAAPDGGRPIRAASVFEFRDVQPGEYQAVAVKIEEGSMTGFAIATGKRVMVDDQDIVDLELQIGAGAAVPTAKRQGGASAREAVVLDSINRPPPDALSNPLPIRPSPSPTSSPSAGGGTNNARRKEIIEQILVGIMTAAFVFGMW